MYVCCIDKAENASILRYLLNERHNTMTSFKVPMVSPGSTALHIHMFSFYGQIRVTKYWVIILERELLLEITDC